MSTSGTSGSARDTGQAMVHFYRKRVRFSDAAFASANGMKIGRLPARAYIGLIDWHVATAFNSGTSDTLQLGSTPGAADILAATTIHASGITHHTAAAGLGIAVTPTFTTDVDIWAKWTASGAAATAGELVLIIFYVPELDG